MKAFEIEFYIDHRDKCPVEDFINSLETKAQLKIAALLNLLEKEGPDLRRPHADFLQDGIYELRIPYRKNQFRLLYFFMIKNRIILSHGFNKKVWRVPSREIAKAKKHRDLLEEKENQI